MKLGITRVFILSTLFIGMPVHARQDPSTWTVKITKIYDGDTFNFEAPMLPTPLQNMKVRIRGIDAPEKGGRAKCQSEKDKATKALEKLTKLKGTAIWAELSNLGWDKYGGRVVADVKLNGVDVKTEMLKDHLVVEYSGQGKKQDWCQIKKELK